MTTGIVPIRWHAILMDHPLCLHKNLQECVSQHCGQLCKILILEYRMQHCSLAAPSLCTVKAIRAYFRNGTLPEPGTVCDIQGEIFGDRVSPFIDSLVGEERSMMNAWDKLSEIYSESYFGFAQAKRNVLFY